MKCHVRYHGSSFLQQTYFLYRIVLKQTKGHLFTVAFARGAFVCGGLDGTTTCRMCMDSNLVLGREFIKFWIVTPQSKKPVDDRKWPPVQWILSCGSLDWRSLLMLQTLKTKLPN